MRGKAAGLDCNLVALKRLQLEFLYWPRQHSLDHKRRREQAGFDAGFDGVRARLGQRYLARRIWIVREFAWRLGGELKRETA